MAVASTSQHWHLRALGHRRNAGRGRRSWDPRLGAATARPLWPRARSTSPGGRRLDRLAGRDGSMDSGASSTREEASGSDRIAVAHRARERSYAVAGRGAPLVVVGDTPHDTRCGAVIGARTVGVATGPGYTRQTSCGRPTRRSYSTNCRSRECSARCFNAALPPHPGGLRVVIEWADDRARRSARNRARPPLHRW